MFEIVNKNPTNYHYLLKAKGEEILQIIKKKSINPYNFFLKLCKII